MMKRSDQAALEQREVTFNRVGVGIAANVFPGAVVSGTVREEVLI